MNAMTESGIAKHRLTVDEYYRMAEVSLLAPDARVELIDGDSDTTPGASFTMCSAASASGSSVASQANDAIDASRATGACHTPSSIGNSSCFLGS